MRARRAGAAAVLAAAALLLSACSQTPKEAPSVTTASTATFQNPIVSSGADPWMFLYRGRYYLIQSDSNRLVVTSDTRLTDIADGTATTVWTPPTSGSHCTDLWAPELHHIGDRWWIYYAATTCDGNNDHHRMFALESTSDDPAGHYVDRGEVRDAAGRWAIDGTRSEWKGSAYFAWSGWPGAVNGRQNLYIAKMSSPDRLEGTGVLLSEPDLAWEQVGMPIEEGPEGLADDGVLHVVYSASGSWTDSYCLGMLTLKAGGDPMVRADWTKTPKPVFAGNTDVTSPGHASFTVSPDGTQHWIVYHSAREPGAGWDRVIDTQPFRFGADGTPEFGTPVAPGRSIPVPSGQHGS